MNSSFTNNVKKNVGMMYIQVIDTNSMAINKDTMKFVDFHRNP